MEDTATATVGRVEGLDDGEERQDKEDERGPADEGNFLVDDYGGVSDTREICGRRLTDREEGPGDDGGTSGVTLRGGKGISGSRGLEEHKREEHKDLGPDTGLLNVGVDAKGLEEGDDNENDSPCGMRTRQTIMS